MKGKKIAGSPFRLCPNCGVSSGVSSHDWHRCEVVLLKRALAVARKALRGLSEYEEAWAIRNRIELALAQIRAAGRGGK